MCRLFFAKRIIHCHVQLCIFAFRNRKDGRSKECKQKIFAAQTPQRKRGYVEDFTLKSVNALNMDFAPQLPLQAITVRPCSLRQNRRTTGARMGLISNQNLFISTLTFTPCHVAVCVNCILGAKVLIFYCYFTVNRTYFSARLAYRQETWFKFNFYV